MNQMDEERMQMEATNALASHNIQKLTVALADANAEIARLRALE